MSYLPTDASELFVMCLVAMLAAMGLMALVFWGLLSVVRGLRNRAKARLARRVSRCVPGAADPSPS